MEVDENMALCMFKFIFDINLTFPPGVCFHTKRDDTDVLLSFQRVKAKKVLSLSDSLEWINDNNESIFVAALNQQGEKIPFRQYKRRLNDGLPFSGIVDGTYYTIIETIFKINDISLLNDEKYMTAKKEWLQDILTNFIDNYVFITEDVSFSRRTIFQPLFIQIFWTEKDYGFPDVCISEITMNKFKVEINWRNPYSTGYIKNDISLDQVNTLCKRLENNNEVKLFEKLLLDAREQAFILENYNISIILTESAFEVFLQSILVECCRNKKITRLLTRHKKEKEYIEAISNGNVRDDLIHNYFKYLTGQNIAGSREYNSWYTNTYAKRNDIVHKGEYIATKEEAKNAFESTVKLINLIINIMANTRSYVPKSISHSFVNVKAD